MHGLLLHWPGAAALAAPFLAGFLDLLKSRKKQPAPAEGKPAPMFPPMEPGDGPEGSAGAGAPQGPRGKKREHVAPKIVAHYGPPPPAVKPLEPS